MNIERHLDDLFSHDPLFQSAYQDQRMDLYLKLLNIVKDFKIKSIIDIGCAYGLFVEICNQSEIDAYGFDLPIENLQNFHQKLELSKQKFIYGSVNGDDFYNGNKLANVEAFSIFDVLRHILQPENLTKLKTKYVIIRELSNNIYLRAGRKKQKLNLDVSLYSPIQCLKLFNDYSPVQIHFYHYKLKINNPNFLTLWAINAIFPSYTLVLKRKYS